MRLYRIYYPIEAQLGNEIVIEGEKGHYLRTVLRIKQGVKLRVFNHLRQEFIAIVKVISKKNLQLEIIETLITIQPSKLKITLVQALSKGERMDYTIQKATELGIHTILPIISEYCEAKIKVDRLEKKLNHWRNISISASEQSFRVDIPEIKLPVSIQEYTKNHHQGILLEPEEQATIQSIAKLCWLEFDIAVGPEGGWSVNDLNLLKASGLSGIQLGPRILRTETVAPVILAGIHSLWGDFV